MINLNTKNRAFLSALKKGCIAANCGNKRNSNPYKDKRKLNGAPTWSLVFIRYWEYGFDNSEIDGFASLKEK